MFQLVKAMGDLPKFVYLLLFQRSTVEMCLNNSRITEGASTGKDCPGVARFTSCFANGSREDTVDGTEWHHG